MGVKINRFTLAGSANFAWWLDSDKLISPETHNKYKRQYTSLRERWTHSIEKITAAFMDPRRTPKKIFRTARVQRLFNRNSFANSAALAEVCTLLSVIIVDRFGKSVWQTTRCIFTVETWIDLNWFNFASSSDVNKTKFLRPRPKWQDQDQDHRNWTKTLGGFNL